MFLASIIACTSEPATDTPTEPASPVPVATPLPSPDPAPSPTPPTPYTPPPAETSLRLVPTNEWPDLCAATAPPQPGGTLMCGPVELPLPSMTPGEQLTACVSQLGDSASIVGCDATVGDLITMQELTWTCDSVLPPPEAQTRLESCGAEPLLPDPLPGCPSLAVADPEDGGQDEFIGRPLVWTFSDHAPDLHARLLDSSGTVVPGTGSWDQGASTVYSFQPDDRLDPATDYQVELTWCGGFQTATLSFATSALGTPVDVTTLQGQSFELQLQSSASLWISPQGAGSLLQAFLERVPALTIVDAQPGALEVRAGQTLVGLPIQDTCFPTRSSTLDTDDNPFFDAVPIDMALFGVMTSPLTADLAIESGGTAGIGAVHGILDTRELIDFLFPGGGDDAGCDLFMSLGSSCEPCPDGLEFCVTIDVVDIPVTLAPYTVTEITAQDVALDPSCP